MKKDIHPKVNTECVVTCACGNTFKTMSTLPSISVEICSACHPFYTGTRRFVDTERRIDKFNKKMELAETRKKEADKIKENKKSSKRSSKTNAEINFKELLKQAKSEETGK